MIDFFVNIHDFFYGINEKNHYRKNNIILCILCNLIYRIAIYILSLYLRIRNVFLYTKIELNSEEKQILVSLTTFPARIESVWMTIESLLRQTVRPNKIIINLAKEEFGDTNFTLPNSIERYVKQGIEIVFNEVNLKPHNKYYYSIIGNNYKYLITVDDDLFYNKHTIERLLELNNRYPNSICSNRVRNIKLVNNDFCSYSEWTQKVDNNILCSHFLLALGYGGVLYPVKIIEQFNTLLNKEEIMKYSPKADDLWLKANELMEDVKVCSGLYMASPVEIIGSQKISLKSSNNSTFQSGNDTQWKSLSDQYCLINFFQKSM